MKMNNIKPRTAADPVNISSICPGVDYLINQNYTQDMVLQVNVSDCENNLPQYTAHQGVVYGVCGDSISFCKMAVQSTTVALLVHIKRLAYDCTSSLWRTQGHCRLSCCVQCGRHSQHEMFFECNDDLYLHHINTPMINMNIEVREKPDFIIEYIMEHTGYIVIPAYSLAQTQYIEQHELKVEPRSAIVVSICNSIDMPLRGYHSHQVQFVYRKANSSHEYVAKVRAGLQTKAYLFLASYFQIVYRPGSEHRNHHLKAYISVIPESEGPQKLPGGLFNCSVGHFTRFQDILHCNLKAECEDGRDETEHCPFSSPGCQGLVASRNKCYECIGTNMYTSTVRSQGVCQARGGKLASVKTKRQKKDSLHIFKHYSWFVVAFGLTAGWFSQPFAYSKSGLWSDNTVAYNVGYFQSNEFVDLHQVTRHARHFRLFKMKISRYGIVLAVFCEIKSQNVGVFSPHIVLAELLSISCILTNTRQFLSVTPGSHTMHRFWLCSSVERFGSVTDSQWRLLEHKNDEHNISECDPGKVADVMFQCDEDLMAVHHTLVCDFHNDCPDTSDESFCEHPTCPGFLCLNGQCVLDSQRCNEYSDCLDHSDESHCPNSTRFSLHASEHSLHIDLDGTGYFTRQKIREDEPCPDSHYRCTAEWLYCLPVYTRCNGLSDCVYGEDEQDCVRETCPGFYQCRDSTVCVHGHHLCDGWGQCPQRDDELMCDMTCPEGCLCQGHSFWCSTTFLPDPFPELRYLDATGTGMSVTDFRMNTYLIVLVLSDCSLFNVSKIKLTNLQYIDLSNNHLDHLHVAHVLQLPHLEILHLTNNHLSQITNKLGKHVNYALRRVSLSRTHPNIVNTLLSIYCFHAEWFNISLSSIQRITSLGFKNTPRLTEVDVRWNPLHSFPWDSLSAAMNLKSIFSSDYRFCCKNLLPHSTRLKCQIPHTFLEACNTLLPSGFYRMFFWLTSISAIVGNSACFLASFAVIKLFERNFLTTIGHLQFVNVCMGGHVGITIAVDRIMHGRYIQTEKEWTNSITCKASGFLWFVSNEVSVFIVLFITLNHFILLYFPNELERQNKRSTVIALSEAWIVGIVLSVIPFLPGVSHWGLHGQSGLCRLALFTRFEDVQTLKWFTVVLIVNSILCFIIIGSLVAIHKRIPRYRIKLDPSKRSLYFSSHLTTKIAVTNAVCWLTCGLVMMMTSAGVTVVDRIQEAMVVFVLPLHSALCPFLYLWTVAAEQRGQAQEKKLLKILNSRVTFQRKQQENQTIHNYAALVETKQRGTMDPL